MATAVFGNAIGWAQFRMLGGWKNIAGTVFAYTLALGSLMFVLPRLNGSAGAVTYSFFLGIYLTLQVLVAMIYGSMRVAGAVRNDVASGVIESHRLMPVSPMSAVLGYLFGSTFQAACLFAANFVLGAIAVSASHLSMQSWVICNGVLLWFAMCVWTVVQFFAYRSSFGAMGGILVLIVGWWLAAGGEEALPIPALKVLYTPLAGHTIFDMRSGIGGIDKAYLIGGVAQLAIGLLYCFASAERYRRDDLVGFDPLIAMQLVGVVTAASVVGLKHPEWFITFGRARIERESAFEMSVILVLILAILPISSAVRLSVVPPAGMDRRHLPPILSVFGTFAIAMMLVLVPAPVPAPGPRFVRTAITMLAFLVSVRYLFGIIHRLKLWPRRAMMIWLVLTWFVPVAVELMRYSWEPDPSTAHMSQLAFVSPPAEIYQTWSHDPMIHSSGIAGLAVQCALASLLGIAYLIVSGQKRQRKLTPLATTA